MSRFSAAVIGTVFTDIKGFSAAKYNPMGRNLGRVDISQGGVGRNVAENLANLGHTVQFVSSVDEGMVGDGVLSHLSLIGVDTAKVKKAQYSGMGIWMLINDQKGEQAASLSQLPDPLYIESVLNNAGSDIIADSDNVVLEMDVSTGVTEKTFELAEKYNKKVYAIPATMDIVMKAPHMLSRVECFICNHIEAGKLFNADTSAVEPKDMIEVLKQGIDDLDIPSMVVTMGAMGAVYCDRRTGVFGFVNAEKVDVVDSSGAGDAFFSGTVAALIKGERLEQAVQCGTRLAALTIQFTGCTCEADVIKKSHIL